MEVSDDPFASLGEIQAKFVAAFVETLDYDKAIEAVVPEGTTRLERTRMAVAMRNDPGVSNAIAQFWAIKAMEREEAVARLALLARSAPEDRVKAQCLRVILEALGALRTSVGGGSFGGNVASGSPEQAMELANKALGVG